jgi:hypothetical protein
MTRKCYDTDSDQEEEEESPIDSKVLLLKEKKEQQEYERQCKQDYEKTLTFEIKHQDQLHDMYMDLKDAIRFHVNLDDCPFSVFAKFIETPSTYVNSVKPTVLALNWCEEHESVLKYHYKTLVRFFPLFSEQKVAFTHFKFFCYQQECKAVC